MNYLAQQSNPIGPLSGIGNLGLQGGTYSNAITLLAQVISAIIGLLTIIGALYFMFMLITGAIAIISSGGDKAAYENARRKLSTGVIGFVAVIAGMFIMSLIAILLGLPSILDLGAMIEAIRLP
ncbi:hypothetical protein A2715_03900 [Candidatus Woesebacteria bacterium RIFCSPHIGHO2_01_FULL_39_32]|uniref:Uncharacterized protein n=1 Tax=Candidatus Woesebacteria bacterium RIFCSPLOWO2_01_FULL_39_25 TaxID=1802521 RepID=A0A1F8BIW7_9BACT|nr:MAG: hypothetical protein A2124_03075 [Candidatus Woesebacteria bacterium GWB1_37_5]OGM25057.1 MAG: hypothetical protein A2715_03900 [Candidatus Woesebacteria bacterium RIFCSPHIGHO2_01_FULL_39_32]OGM35534.1 MAG: hypothetical protein A3F01_05060 [Candidatus Woesebacteria bacterium RIFCSPHIGHO2_12_FULL_38_11]OGM63972.1 MAG: hypothetical protein A2893_00490 [Candidatus Woesebacteria bacterium RIFCSPLOWO2_01_FULL_39_25]